MRPPDHVGLRRLSLALFRALVTPAGADALRTPVMHDTFLGPCHDPSLLPCGLGGFCLRGPPPAISEFLRSQIHENTPAKTAQGILLNYFWEGVETNRTTRSRVVYVQDWTLVFPAMDPAKEALGVQSFGEALQVLSHVSPAASGSALQFASVLLSKK